jgi:Uma2 family endonuclease
MSIEKYEAMVASGVFSKHDRFHLINGLLVAKMAEYPPHKFACDALRFALESLLPAGWYLRIDKPLRIPTRASEPEPDLVVARGSSRDFAEQHPEPSQVPFVVEVASSSLSQDRGMIRVYGGGGVATHWIVNLIGRKVKVYKVASPDGYQTCEDYEDGQQVRFILDGVERGRIGVTDILPRRS